MSDKQDLTLNDIEIKVVSDEDCCNKAIKHLISFKPKIVGFDCEWNSLTNVCYECCKEYDKNRSRVSLMQIAHNSLIILIRIHLLHSIPDILITFLSNNKIIKAGVGIFQDVQKLKRYYKLQVFGCVELNEIIFSKLSHNTIKRLFHPDKDYIDESNKNTYCKNQRHRSLNDLSIIMLKKRMMYKHLRFSRDWEHCNTLSKEQILYSADDAWIGYEIFMKLTEIILNESNYSNSNEMKEMEEMEEMDVSTNYFGVYHEIIDLDCRRRGGKRHKKENNRQIVIKQPTNITKLVKQQNDSRKKFSLSCLKFKENMKNMHDFMEKHQLLSMNDDVGQLLKMQNKLISLQKEHSEILMSLHQKQSQIIENCGGIKMSHNTGSDTFKILNYLILIFEKDRTLNQ